MSSKLVKDSNHEASWSKNSPAILSPRSPLSAVEVFVSQVRPAALFVPLREQKQRGRRSPPPVSLTLPARVRRLTSLPSGRKLHGRARRRAEGAVMEGGRRGGGRSRRELGSSNNNAVGARRRWSRSRWELFSGGPRGGAVRSSQCLLRGWEMGGRWPKECETKKKELGGGEVLSWFPR